MRMQYTDFRQATSTKRRLGEKSVCEKTDLLGRRLSAISQIQNAES